MYIKLCALSLLLSSHRSWFQTSTRLAKSSPQLLKEVSAVSIYKSDPITHFDNTFESLLAELEVQCEPVEDEVAEEVVEIEDLKHGKHWKIVENWTQNIGR